MSMKLGLMTVNEGDRVTVTCTNDDVLSITAYKLIEDETEVLIFTSGGNYISVDQKDIAMVSVEPCQKIQQSQ